jgi:PAS domain S-box-containing protein
VSFSDLLAETILSARSDAIISADREGIINFWNPGAERLFGYSRDEAVSRSLDLIIPERLRKRHWNGYGQVMQTGQSRYGEGEVLSVPALRKDGTTISVEFTVVPLKSEVGQMIGMAAILRDVTMRFNEIRVLKRALADIAKASTKKA